MTEAKLIGALLVLIAVLGGAFVYTKHERDVGETKIEAADKAADAKIAAQVASQTAELKAKSDMAEKGAQDAEQKLQDYMASMSSAPVRVCHENNSGPGLSKAPAPISTASGTSPGSGTLPAVPARVIGPDISAELDTIVRAAAELAISDREFQQR